MSEDAADTVQLDAELLSILVCPLTRSPLRQDGAFLIASAPPEAGLKYPIRDGIPVLLIDEAELPEGVETLEAFKTKFAAFVAPPA